MGVGSWIQGATSIRGDGCVVFLPGSVPVSELKGLQGAGVEIENRPFFCPHPECVNRRDTS